MFAVCAAAIAAPESHAGLATGADLAAWQAIGAEAPDATLIAFIQAWPTSRLAERAWVALDDPGAAAGALPPGLALRLEASARTHADALARMPSVVVVAPLDLGAPLTVPEPEPTLAQRLADLRAPDPAPAFATLLGD